MPWSALEGALVKCGVPAGISWVSLTAACTQRFAAQRAVRACMPLFWLSLALKWHLGGGRCCLLGAVAPVLRRGSPGKAPGVLLQGLGSPRCAPRCSKAASPSPRPWCGYRKAARVRPRALIRFAGRQQLVGPESGVTSTFSWLFGVQGVIFMAYLLLKFVFKW